jgi:serine/threonine-protein kinase
VSSVDRFCPLCDEQVASEICPRHRVPTIAPASGDPVTRAEPGAVIGGRYRIDRVLGQGGMGTIFAATHLGIEDQVVLKVLRDANVQQRTYLRRFYQEARAISRLDHPNIVHMMEFGFDPSAQVPFLVMEHVAGRTLRELIRDEGALPERRAIEIALQIARALLEAHEKGVLHRDLKPDNIMIGVLADGSEHVKVLDFGLAKLTEGDTSTPPLTVPGRVVGTPSFMAPEQVLHGPQDFRTDLYGLGCVLHALLIGRPPFFSKDRLEVMRRKVREPAPPLPDRLPCGSAPTRALTEVHRALLATERSGRPSSTRDVVRVLSAIANRSTEPANLEPTAPYADTVPLVRTVFEADTQIAAQPDLRGLGRQDLARTAARPRPAVARFELPAEEEVSGAELETIRAALALDVPDLPGRMPVPHGIERAHRAWDPATTSDADGANGDWTSVVPSNLEKPPSTDAEAPTPMTPAQALEEMATAPRAEAEAEHAGPPTPVRSAVAHDGLRRVPEVRVVSDFGLRSGLMLTAVSLLVGTILAFGVLRLARVGHRASPSPSRADDEERTTREVPLPDPSVQAARRAPPPPPVAEKRPTVSIQSDPSRADVFDGDVRLGATPLDVTAPARGAEEKKLHLVKPGFEDAWIDLDGNSHDRVLVELKSTHVKKKRTTGGVSVW